MMHRGKQQSLGGFSMVFYDRLGIRKQYIWGLALVALFVGACIGALVYTALAFPPTAAAYSYTNREEDAQYQKTIALTFDDGPHPKYTEEVLAILEAEQVPATFFLIGESVVAHPNIARSIVDRGFEIGNHSFTHSTEVQSSRNRLRNELIATDRVIRDATGRSPILFRPPMLENVDVGEFDGARIAEEELRWAEDLGYVVVGANLDTQDWNVGVGEADLILARIEDRLPESGPIVLLMHEEAGDGASLEALRAFIPEMKARGYRFVFVSEYFGLTPHETMPEGAASTLDSFLIAGAKALVFGTSTFNRVVLVISIFGLLRLWSILALRRTLTPFAYSTRASVRRRAISVIIPAYNEAANIDATVRSVFASMGSHDELIVVDDGSTDGTLAIVRDLQRFFGERLRVLAKENGGTKGAALQYALPFARNEIMVCIDADTIIDGEALTILARHFDDERVGAVAGKVYPAHIRSLLGVFQYLEYIQGQNLDKAVFAAGNAINVVPGAIGAWRATAVAEAGGYSLDTVVEDQDLTLALLTHGWRIQFDPDAKAYTETPDTVQQFFRQRYRWVYGTIQCIWKYRAWFFSLQRPSLGWVILPNALIFNLLIPALVPVLDIALLLGLAGLVNIWSVLIPFLVYTLFDMWGAIEGLSYEKEPPYRLIPLVVWQRFFYRYALAAAIIQSVGVALAGTFVAWGEQTRRGECHPALQNLIQTGSALTPSPIQIASVAPTATDAS